MAVIRNTASAMMRGRVGNTTYYVAQSRQLARQAMNNSNYGASASRTERQQSRRVKLANLIHFYRFNRDFMQKAFGKLGGGVSVFNEFVKLNLNNASVALTKEQALSPIWVPEGYQVTKGTLPELSMYGDPEEVGMPMYIDNIKADYTAPEEGADTRTMGGLAQYIINKNPQFKAGDMITTATYQGIQDYSDDPSTSCYIPTVVINQLVLDPTSTAPIDFKWDPDRVGGAGLPVFDEGNFCVAVHSRNENGQLLVSTARMAKITSSIAEDFKVSEEWYSDAQVQKAIASYGVDGTVLLQPTE
jgi:hypothetical protein